MVKKLTTAFSVALALSALTPAQAQKRGHSSGTTAAKPALKFLNTIELSMADGAQAPVSQPAVSESSIVLPESVSKPETTNSESQAIERASSLQLKYAVLLNTEVEEIENAPLFAAIDEWYGTRYELGGSTKAGIDCSAFVQAIYSKLFQIAMPRTAKEQHKATQTISRTELKQGDLVFFNTHGSGVSHVGIYLQNNKFVHAATSGGVMVSDLFEEYWVKHFVGAGRYACQIELQTLAVKP
ncbi:MAG TPA: NlpC/P60 family protein [Chitinophagaceae bacterium]|nr:NlpC/P60 family protein [Chitinophagaceae bacterium]